MKKLMTTLFVSSLLVACAPQNVKEDGAAGTMAGAGADTSSGVETGGLSGSGIEGGTLLSGLDVSYEKSAINDTNNVLIEKVIYFAYDSDQISEEYQTLIAHHGKYLAANADMQVRIEGHADERGSREYNVALANRRAQSVRRLVLFQGAAAEQVEVVSYGEEKPVALGHDEESCALIAVLSWYTKHVNIAPFCL